MNMDGWLIKLFTDVGSVAHMTLLVGMVAACGLALGSVRAWGVSLGIGGVLFAGLFFGHFTGKHLAHRQEMLRQQIRESASTTAEAGLKELAGKAESQKHVMEFVREFGLILFVYTIGLQVGPGFLASLRRQGLPLNLMAGSVVLLGTLAAV